MCVKRRPLYFLSLRFSLPTKSFFSGAFWPFSCTPTPSLFCSMKKRKWIQKTLDKAKRRQREVRLCVKHFLKRQKKIIEPLSRYIFCCSRGKKLKLISRNTLRLPEMSCKVKNDERLFHSCSSQQQQPAWAHTSLTFFSRSLISSFCPRKKVCSSSPFHLLFSSFLLHRCEHTLCMCV